MITVKFQKATRNDGTPAWGIVVNHKYICNFPNFHSGARTIYPHISKKNID